MSERIKDKYCPFCGSSAHRGMNKCSDHVFCEGCDCTVKLKTWNTRALTLEKIEKVIILNMYNTTTPLPEDCDGECIHCTMCKAVKKTAQAILDLAEGRVE